MKKDLITVTVLCILAFVVFRFAAQVMDLQHAMNGPVVANDHYERDLANFRAVHSNQ